MYKYYRSTPLVRAYGLEKALDTPAHIYFKNESVSPVGSHKLNSALAQAYYCKKEGTTNVTTETGAGQWGTALAYACSVFGLELAVYMVKISYEQKPYRRSLMQTFGAQVTASPSMSTRAGKDILTRDPAMQRLAGHGHIGSHRTGAHDATLQVRAGLGDEPRGTAPDHYRPRGGKADGDGRRISRQGDSLLRRWFELLGHRFPLHAPQPTGRPDDGVHRRRTGLVPETDARQVRIRLRRRERLHALAADVHPRPQLHAGQHPRRRPCATTAPASSSRN